MKAQELKQIIKPLIKECLKEVLIEEGFTKMLSESAKQPVQQQIKKEISFEQNQKQATKNVMLQETKKKLLDEIGNTGFDAFAGTTPLKEDAEVVGSDPGVNISKLMNNNRGTWNQILQGMTEKKK